MSKNKICRRLKLAEFLEDKGLTIPRNNVLTSQQRQLSGLSEEAILAEAADELKILFEVRKGFGE